MSASKGIENLFFPFSFLKKIGAIFKSGMQLHNQICQ